MSFAQLAQRIGGGQVNYHFNFSLRHRYLYVQNSKCGCTYLKSSLTQVELADARFFDASYRYTDYRVVVPDAMGKSPHQPVNRAVFVKPYQLGVHEFDRLLANPAMFRFAVVRNPYKRALSAYFDTMRKGRAPFLTLRASLARVKGIEPAAVLPEEVRFTEFLLAIEQQAQEQGWKHVDQHYRAQSVHLSDDIVRYDRIFRMEQFDEALIEIGTRIGVRLPPGNRGRHLTHSNERMAEGYADPACRSLVQRIYAADLERYGYDFPAD